MENLRAGFEVLFQNAGNAQRCFENQREQMWRVLREVSFLISMTTGAALAHGGGTSGASTILAIS